MVADFRMIGFGALTLVPVFTKDILHSCAAGFGHLLSWQGIGALIGALVLVFYGDHFHNGKKQCVHFGYYQISYIIE